MTNTEEKGAACPTHLIPDQVATKDAFQHNEVALAIADMVLHEDGGGAIALTGAWGSGKSTVVKFLEAELNQSSPPTGTFIFDAWAHQGDPLRRTFLEKLIRWCNDQENPWTRNPAAWDGVIDELAKRTEWTKTRSYPDLELAGALAGAFLLLVPLAVQMYIKNKYAHHPIWDGIGILFSVLPAMIAFGALIYWYFRKRGNPADMRGPLASLISSGAVTKTTSETSKTPDPTSIEFEKHYRNLLAEALTGNDKRLLIVVDNLDRIVHDDARSIWATLRVFFDPSIDRSAGWHKRVWVLVPFDPEAINDLWDMPPENKELRPAMSRHFLEKTFQASFRVPPIILSNWENFLVTQLRFAFPGANHTEDEFHTIFRLYDRLRPTDNGSPTPRNLKLFVNRVGALHRQWHDKIPLTQQAAFALIADDKPETILEILLGGDAPQFPPTITQKLSGLLDPEWQRNLAALFFNLPPAAATEALLSPPIRKALNDGDAEALAAQETFPGFPAVLEDIIEDTRFGMRVNPEQFAQAAIAFSGIKGTGPEYDRCRAHIYHTAKLVKQWQPFNDTIARGIGQIANIVPDRCDLSPLIQGIRNSLSAQANTKEWCEAIALALPPLILRDRGAVKNNFRVQATAAQFLTIVGHAQATGKFTKIWKYMQPSAARDEITGIIAKQAEEGRWDVDASNIVRTLRQIDDSWNWNPLIAALQARIQNTPQAPPSDVSAALDILFHLSPQLPEAHEALQAAANGDVLFQQFYFLIQAGNQAAAAICTLALLTSDAHLQPIPQPQFLQNTPQWRANQGKQTFWSLLRNPNSNEAMLKALSVKSGSWLALKSWREKAQARPETAPLISQILKLRFQNASIPTVSSEELIANVDYWTGVAGKNAIDTLFSEKSASGELASALLKLPFSLKDQHLHLLALAKKGAGTYPSFLADNLRRLSSNDWLTALKGESEIIDAALSLGEGGLRLGQPLQDALDAHVKIKLHDDSNGRLARRWQEVVRLLESDDYEVFAKRLLSHFTSVTGRIKGLLQYYGPILTRVATEDGPTRSIQRVIQIIEAHEAAEVAWLADVVKLWPEGGSRAIRADWLSRAEKCADEEKLPEGQKDALQNLIGALSQGG